MKRGEVWLANFDPVKGSEQAGLRPVLIIQVDPLNAFLRTVVIVPFTTNLRWKKHCELLWEFKNRSFSLNICESVRGDADEVAWCCSLGDCFRGAACLCLAQRTRRSRARDSGAQFEP
ncbi:type II toxin-antitoxin system PemK/MazF family toxin [Fervidibacter sacchari]